MARPILGRNEDFCHSWDFLLEGIDSTNHFNDLHLDVDDVLDLEMDTFEQTSTRFTTDQPHSSGKSRTSSPYSPPSDIDDEHFQFDCVQPSMPSAQSCLPCESEYGNHNGYTADKDQFNYGQTVFPTRTTTYEIPTLRRCGQFDCVQPSMPSAQSYLLCESVYCPHNGYTADPDRFNYGQTVFPTRTTMYQMPTLRRCGQNETASMFSRRTCIYTLDNIKHCVFCKKNGETVEYYSTHIVKNMNGKVICPILRRYVCPICKATGDSAHTLSHCPFNQKRIS